MEWGEGDWKGPTIRLAGLRDGDVTIVVCTLFFFATLGRACKIGVVGIMSCAGGAGR